MTEPVDIQAVKARLHLVIEYGSTSPEAVCRDALCAIEQLEGDTSPRAEQAEADLTLVREALRPFAEWKWCEEDETCCNDDSGPYCQTHGDAVLWSNEIGIARRALSGTAETTEGKR